MYGEPLLRQYSPFLQLIFLVMIILVTLLFTLLIGIVFSFIFFGPETMTELMNLKGDTMLSNIPLQKYLQVVSQFGTFIFPAFIFAFLVSRNPMDYMRLKSPPRIFTLFLAIAAFMVILPFIGWLTTVNGQLHLPDFLNGLEQWMRTAEEQAQQLTEAFLSDTTITGLLINLFMIGILAAIGEELIFRGLAIRLLNEWLGNKHLAVWIAAIIFSAFHLQFYGFLPRTVLGVLLGYLFIWSGTLWVPIITHLLNNTMAVMVMYFNSKGIIKADLEEFGSSTDGWVILITTVLSLGLMAMIFLYEKRKRLVNSSQL